MARVVTSKWPQDYEEVEELLNHMRQKRKRLYSTNEVAREYRKRKEA